MEKRTSRLSTSQPPEGSSSLLLTCEGAPAGFVVGRKIGCMQGLESLIGLSAGLGRVLWDFGGFILLLNTYKYVH